MSSQSADQPAADQAPAPVGLRELPPQPAKPVMPAYTMPVPGPLPPAAAAPAPAARVAGPAPDDSVIARDDHFEGTFTSRGTIRVMGSVKGRIEAVRVRIEEGAMVDADVIVDEAIIAGAFTGNLTCRERLEAHASGRINGRVETFRLMLHEGASVEGEMHMLTDAPRDAATTIRGSAPLRGEAAESGSTPLTAPGAPVSTKPATSVAPSSAAKSPHKPAAAVATTSTGGSTATPGTPTAGATNPGTTAAAAQGPAGVATPGAEAILTPRRSPVAEALRLETLVVAPRTLTSTNRYSGSTSSPRPAGSSGSRPRNGTTTGF
jgi:cytoskeletal protein CcmA (bactofilin family)